MRKCILTVMLFTGMLSITAIELDSTGRAKDYVNTIIERSQKVTDALNITGTAAGNQVLNIVANRYFKLYDIYAERDSLKKAYSFF